MSAPRCSNCGGELPEVLYRRTIACPYCSTSQPNPGCLRVDDEVLAPAGKGFQLHRVASCDGPDAITLTSGGAAFRLEDLIPVARATDALESGTGVYRRESGGWSLTYTSTRPEGGMVKVKHDNAAFQDAFFDQEVALADLRLDARPPEAGGKHPKRSALGGLAARFQAAPMGTLFEVGVKAFIAVVFVIVAVSVLRGFLWH